MKLLMGIILAVIILPLTNQVYGVSLKDYTPYKYEVLFTNPECSDYRYEAPVENNQGELVTQKPKGAYCKKSDATASALRPSSPEYRLISWINDPGTSEIFFSYLSFSNQRVANALCQAITERNVKVSFLLDRRTGKKVADFLLKCRPNSSFSYPHLPQVHYSGHTGGTGYAHNKYFIINPQSKLKVKIAFSSGNLSSGTVLHHENWHFVTTNIRSHFAQIHLCMMEGTLNHDQDLESYAQYIRECRQEIETPEEDDIKVFLVPGEGERAMSFIANSMARSNRVYLAAHRFSNYTLIDLLTARLESKTPVEMKLVVDDDIYWIGALGVSKFGANRWREHEKIQGLKESGLNVRYIQTNHNSWLLHHNKFIIFQGEEEYSLFAGAGNLTRAAFTKNFENFYHITIPEVVSQFVSQYHHLFNTLGTSDEGMPMEDISL